MPRVRVESCEEYEETARRRGMRQFPMVTETLRTLASPPVAECRIAILLEQSDGARVLALVMWPPSAVETAVAIGADDVSKIVDPVRR